MLFHLLTLAGLGVAASPLPPLGYRLEGVVVNGTRGDVPVAGAEVILRAGEDGALIPVAKVVADERGRFAFGNLPVEPGMVFRPGANRDGVHYPGPRLLSGEGTAGVKLTVFDAVTKPSPLVADLLELDIVVESGVLTVKETVVIDNPTLTTYVGEPTSAGPPLTFSLRIPPGYERVTFSDEFHGRHSQIVEGRVVTDIPWTPGKRELRYTYQLPVEEGRPTLERALDVPSSRVRVRVRGEEAREVLCNLPRAAGDDGGAVVFESSGDRLPAGHAITLQFSQAAVPWIVSARWAAVGGLAVLIFGTAVMFSFSLRKQSARNLPVR